MRQSIKRPSVIIPRPTKASLARQSKIRNSILVSSSTTTTITNSLNTLKPIQNEQIKSENDLTTIGLNKQQVQARRASTIAKNNVIFKRRRSLHKLAVIVSGSSLDNSTGNGETLKQVVRGKEFLFLFSYGNFFSIDRCFINGKCEKNGSY